MPFGYLFSVLVVVAIVASTLWPRPTDGPRATPGFVLGTIGNTAPFLLAWYLVLITWLAAISGDLAQPIAWLAVALAALALAGLGRIAWLSGRAMGVLDAALTRALGDDRPRTGWTAHRRRAAWALIAPFRIPDPRVRRHRNLQYGPSQRWNRLDVYRRPDVTSGPVFAYFHPGGFHSGSKNRQAKLLLETLAAHGWVCVSADYHLRTDYRTSLIDAKRVIAWLRAEGHQYGADPATLVVAGGSAGAHLALTCGLSAGQPELQPGFEQIDTSVSAVVGLYGYYGRACGEAQSAPTDFSGQVPPLLVVHGDADPMVGAAGVRGFIDELRARGPGPIGYAELPGAGHNLDLSASLHHAAITTAVLEFTRWLTQRNR